MNPDNFQYSPLLLKPIGTSEIVINANGTLRFHGEYHHLVFVARAQQPAAISGKPDDSPAAMVFCHAEQPATLPLTNAPLAVDRFGAWHARAQLSFTTPHTHCVIAEHPIAIGPVSVNHPIAIAQKTVAGGQWSLQLLAQGNLRFTAVGGSPANNTKANPQEPDVEPLFAFLTNANYIPLAADITATLSPKPTALTFLEMVPPAGMAVPAGLPSHMWNLAGQWLQLAVLDQTSTSFGLPWYVVGADSATIVEGGLAVTRQQVSTPTGPVYAPVLMLKMPGGALRQSVVATGV